MTKHEEQVLKHMKLLGLSREEAEQVVADDELIDKGGRCEWEPSKEEEKAMRKATKLYVTSAPKKTSTRTVTKKENPTKAKIVAAMAKALEAEFGIEVDVTNAEKMIAFALDGANFELNLVQKREKKAK
jgi:hypothetical protein